MKSSMTPSRLVIITILTIVLLTSCAPLNQQLSEEIERPEITVGIYDRGNIPAEEGTVENNRWTRWINEHSPVKVKFVPIPRGDSVQKYNILFGSGNAPDLIIDYDSSFLSQLVSDEQVIPIGDLIDRYSTEYKKLLEDYPLVRKLATESDGNMYLLAQITGLKTNHALVIRNDWLQALNLAVPRTELELLEVLKAFTYKDPDKNGLQDTLGINFTGLGPLLDGKIAGGIRPLDMMFRNVGYVVEEGHVVRAWDQAKAALAYEKQLYQSGVIDPDFLTDKDGEKAKLDFVTGKLGMYWASSGIEDVYPLLQRLKKEVPTADLIAIPLPEGPFGHFNPLAKAPVQFVGAINKQAANPEAVIQYLDFMYSKEVLTTLRYGMEGEHHQRNEQGCYQYMNSEKYTRELSWTLDLYMLSARVILGECNSLAASLNSGYEIDHKYMSLEAEAEQHALNPDREFAFPIWNWPTLSQELQLANADGAAALTAIYYRVITDPLYSVDQAMQDAQQAWIEAGGEKVDAYYDAWFTDQQDRVILTDEYYSIR
ncbi:extracellular solute-binding protein [Paenibacillus daejeonensis]|uniref:extracellular solute-binding protein n=1 Tax=Paenibacillus daejeonensis TaxID=135193 RepID=UPI00035FDEE8|nr:extracellular solute-binding protein [Paenibacillus daejeonensis]